MLRSSSAPRLLPICAPILIVGFGLADSTLAQDDASCTLDVVSIQDRKGFFEGLERINSGKEQEGLSQLVALEERWSGDPDLYILRYNVACAFSRLGRPAEAYDWLQRATESGYGLFGNQMQTLADDPDLAPLRGDPRFDEVYLATQARRQDYVDRIGEIHAPFLWTPPPARVDEGEEPLPPPGVLIALHAYGQNSEQFARRHLLDFARERRLIVLSLNGSTLISPDHWCWAESAGEFIGLFRNRTLEVWQALGKLKREHEIDHDRVFVTGLGQGASLAFAVVARNPQWCKGAILFSGGLSPACLEGWFKPAIHWGRRIAVVHGRNDPLFDHARVSSYVDLLQKNGLDLSMRSHDGGFGVPEDTPLLAAAFDWVDEKPLQRTPPDPDLMLNPGEVPRLPKDPGTDDDGPCPDHP